MSDDLFFDPSVNSAVILSDRRCCRGVDAVSLLSQRGEGFVASATGMIVKHDLSRINRQCFDFAGTWLPFRALADPASDRFVLLRVRRESLSAFMFLLPARLPQQQTGFSVRLVNPVTEAEVVYFRRIPEQTQLQPAFAATKRTMTCGRVAAKPAQQRCNVSFEIDDGNVCGGGSIVCRRPACEAENYYQACQSRSTRSPMVVKIDRQQM